MGIMATPLDLSSTTSKWLARNAVHNIAYVIVNSNAYNNVAPGAYATYSMSPWEKGLITYDVIIGIICVALIAWVIVREKRSKSAN